MSAKTTYAQDIVLKSFLQNTAYTPAATVYLALFTATPSDAGGGTEVSGGSYARTAITFGNPPTAASPGEQLANSATLTFPTATASWGTVGWVGIFDASTSGHMLYWAPLAATQSVTSGNIISFTTGSLIVKEQ